MLAGLLKGSSPLTKAVTRHRTLSLTPREEADPSVERFPRQGVSVASSVQPLTIVYLLHALLLLFRHCPRRTVSLLCRSA